MAPSTTEMAQRWPKDGPKMAPNGPRWAKTGWKSVENAREVVQKREVKHATLWYVDLNYAKVR